MARPSIFAPKDPACRHQGILTKEGERFFAQARARLAKIAKLPEEKVSDGDVFEFLARGSAATRQYLRARG